jgi:streptomycin 6-kinase
MLDHYLRTWSLTDPEPLAQTPTSHVYTVTYQGQRAVLKVLTPVGVCDEKGGAVALAHWNGRGAVRLLREDAQAHLLEYLPGEDLAALVGRGEDDRATTITGEVLNRLHLAPGKLPALTTLNQRFRSLFRRAESDAAYARAARLAHTLLADPHNVHVLHGDMHHENIRWHPERGWLAFDPKGLVGERTYDAANTLCNPMTLPGMVLDGDRLIRQATLLADALHVDRLRLLVFTYAHAHLSASWSLEDGGDPVLALGVAAIIAPYLD